MRPHPEPTDDVARVTRRRVAGAGSGLLIASALGATAGAVEPGTAWGAGTRPRVGATRRSRITRGTTLVHADLHNHTLLSDGDGDPAQAFVSMRSAGLDVAALTDHATLSDSVLGEVLAGILPPEYKQVAGITPGDFARTARLADRADRDGRFTAIRGFEWSEPLLGHVNVWFSEHYIDVVQAGVMQPLLDWLRREPGLVLDGGAGALAGFNHPGREPGRFQEFRYDARVRARVVSLELFNREDDYLFEGYREDGRSSPLVACLNGGWRTGILGVTDEHGTDWGFPEGKGRTGLWVKEHSRAGVKEAMRARRFFATRTSGLRVDATATSGGRTVRMGGRLRHDRGPVRLRLDLARGAEWRGRRLQVQVLRPGTVVPEVADVVDFEVGPVVELSVPVRAHEGDWMLLRIADPTQLNATPGPAGHPGNRLGIAYTSPWWIDPR
ncbi:MAG: hypothetical protein CMH83_02220 [Nocardioides sp.]|nr:hypothetical protein [Nocardioides sp.]